MNRRWLMILIAPLVPVLMGATGCGPKSFTVTVSSSSVNVAQAGTATVTVSLAGTNGFTAPVTLSASGLPNGVTASFNPNIVPIGSSSTLTLSATSSAAAGKNGITITGQAEGQTVNGPLEVNVTGSTTPPAPTAFVEVAAPNPNDPAKVAKLPVTLEGDYAVYQGDILFPANQAINPATGRSTGVAPQGNAMQPGYCYNRAGFCLDRSYLWPNKTLSYQLDSSVSDGLRNSVKKAAGIFMDRAGIQMVESNTAEDRVLVKQVASANGAGGSSAVGRVGGVQTIFFVRMDLPAVLHEFGHALGLWHEQSRGDRNGYIRVFENRITDGKEHNFTLLDDPDVAHPDGPYDFASIMHYDQFAFAKNPSLPVFELVNPSSYDVTKIGSADTLSPGDVLALANLYDTPVTAGSIRLQLSGSNKLVNGGTRTVYVNVKNDGPRDMSDLYFDVLASKTGMTLSGSGTGLVCGSRAPEWLLCHVPVGPSVGQLKQFGPITIQVADTVAAGPVQVSLGLRPVGTRLADPATSKSTVTLQNIRVDPDSYEVDNAFSQANLIAVGGVPQNRTLHRTDDVDFVWFDASDASNTNAYYLDPQALDTDQPFSYEAFDENGVKRDVLETYITKPGKYYVAVSGRAVTRYSLNLWTVNYKQLKDMIDRLRLTPLRLQFNGPAIPRTLVKPVDLVDITGLSVIQAKGANLTMSIVDQNGEIYGRATPDANGVLSWQVPVADGKVFFARLERETDSVTEGNLTIDQPAVPYTINGCSATVSCQGL